jgi:hypothetical protein
MALHKTGLEQFPLEPHFTLEQIKELVLDAGSIYVLLDIDGEEVERSAPIEYFTRAEREAVLAFLADSREVEIDQQYVAPRIKAKRNPKPTITTADLRPLTDADFEVVTIAELTNEDGTTLMPKTKIRMLKNPRPEPKGQGRGEGGKKAKDGRQCKKKRASKSV